MSGAGFLEYKLEYLEKKNLAIGQFVISDDFSAGGHLWRIKCFPRGDKTEHEGNYVSIYLILVSKSENVKAFLDIFVLNSEGQPDSIITRRSLHVFPPKSPWGWTQFCMRSYLEKNCLSNGLVTFMCSIIVSSDNPMPMPPPDIGIHLGRLLDSATGTDVSFIVDGQRFPAHRAVLAARSPVFEAELFGSMADATMPSITVHGIEPAAFKVMLRFMYTDFFPADEELGDSPTDMLQHLLAAADRYALDRLKIMCSLKLIENVTAETVGSVLVYAEAYNCAELKNKCLDFFVVEKNFKEAVFTDGFSILLQKFPSLAAELRKRVVT